MNCSRILAGSALVLLMATATHAQEITIHCDDLGFGCKTMAPIAEKFNQENPGKT